MIFAESKTGIRGLLPYRSTFRLRAMGEKVGALAAQRVFRFKKTGESADVWRSLIEGARDALNCAVTWAVPGHDPNATSHLQELFGITIQRARTVERRKYNHAGPVDVGSMDYPPPPQDGRPVLLVDDIATTGATLATIRDHLRTRGIDALPLALGLNWRLCKGCDGAGLSAQWEAAAAAVHGPARDGNTRRRERRAKGNEIELRACAEYARRERLERDPAAWLRWYMSAAFPLPWGQVHRDMIRAAVRALTTGAGMTTAAPRGTGKTTVLAGLALWAVLSGACRFPVVAGWSHTAARRMLRAWLRALSENERLQDDYPEFAMPFEVSTHANRLKALAWSDSGEPCAADVRTTDGCLVLPSGRGALGAVSVSGSARGLSVAVAGGETIRPDVLLLDDPQDAKTSESEKLSKQVCERIEGDMFSMSGPTARLAVFAAVTIIHENDVATHFLNHPDFEAVKVAQVTAWPEGWDDDNSSVRALWDEWNRARLRGLDARDGGKAARKFYREHKAELTAGMTVSWAARFDKKRRDPDALFAAIWDYYRLGARAFMAERQNAPLTAGDGSVFELPVAHVAGRANGLPRRVAPENAVAIVGMCDINADAARWAAAAVTNERALSIVDYGLCPGHGRPLIPHGESEAVALMRGLTALDAALAALTVTKGADGPAMALDAMLIDCGGSWMQTVFDWLQIINRASRVPWFASRGWGSRGYRPNARGTIGRPGDGWHVSDWQGKGRVLVHNSDLWRHRQQKGWLLPVGAPDSVSLYGDARAQHEVFAEGVCAERLVAYAETEAGPLYRWQITPGMRNDFGDVATGLFVAASRLGFSPTGRQTDKPARKRYSQADFNNPVRRF
jgi:hypothetical protein